MTIVKLDHFSKSINFSFSSCYLLFDPGVRSSPCMRVLSFRKVHSNVNQRLNNQRNEQKIHVQNTLNKT